MVKTMWNIKIIEKGFSHMKDIYIYQEVPGGIEILNNDGPVTTATFFATGSALPEKPSLTLDTQVLQALVDAVIHTGIKPSESYTDGRLEATEEHLKDMRRIVFEKLS